MALQRRATTEDIPALVALVTSAYRGEASKAGWTSEADLLGGQRTDAAMLAETIADPEQVLLVFEDDRALHGCVVVERRDSYGYVGMVTVGPQRQGAGLGRSLLSAAEALIRDDWQLARARMTVIEQRVELIAWYARNGYTDTGETAPFPYGDRRFGEPKRDDLRFVVLEKALT